MREEIKKIKDKLRRKFGYHTFANEGEIGIWKTIKSSVGYVSYSNYSLSKKIYYHNEYEFFVSMNAFHAPSDKPICIEIIIKSIGDNDNQVLKTEKGHIYVSLKELDLINELVHKTLTKGEG